MGTTRNRSKHSNHYGDNLNRREKRIAQTKLSKRILHENNEVHYEWIWIDNEWQWKPKRESYEEVDKNDFGGNEAELELKISEDGQWIWLDEEWKPLANLDPSRNETDQSFISKEVQLVWNNNQWKLITNLNQSDSRIDKDDNYSFCKYMFYINSTVV